MAIPTKAWIILTALLAFPASATAADYQRPSIAPPATSSELDSVRPRGLFYAESDFTLDYNSYSYDDRYHGPAPHYGSRYQGAPYFYSYAPGYPMYRSSTGGTLRYWPR